MGEDGVAYMQVWAKGDDLIADFATVCITNKQANHYLDIMTLVRMTPITAASICGSNFPSLWWNPSGLGIGKRLENVPYNSRIVSMKEHRKLLAMLPDEIEVEDVDLCLSDGMIWWEGITMGDDEFETGKVSTEMLEKIASGKN